MSSKKHAEAAIERQVPPGSKVLNKVAQPIRPDDIKSQEVQSIIEKMYRCIRQAGRRKDQDARWARGSASRNVQRIVIIGVDADGSGAQPELREFINPEIIELSKETEEGREGCFSTSSVCGIVERAAWVKVRAYGRDGQKIFYEFKGFPARVAQHEIDHLDGIRFPDRITDNSKLHWVEEEQFGEYRKHWRQWPVNCPRAKWEAIKSGGSMKL